MFKNMGNVMKQAQQMQEKMREIQEKIAITEFEGNAAAGMVLVIINGKAEMRRLKIDPSLLDPKETDMICDLIVAAFNDAKAKADQYTEKEMSQLSLPAGLSLPF